jgi:hypothetical protein
MPTTATKPKSKPAAKKPAVAAKKPVKKATPAKKPAAKASAKSAKKGGPDIGSGKFKYRWHDKFAVLPMSPLSLVGGRTHGVACLDSGDLLVFAQKEDALLRYGPTGRLKSKIGGQRWTGAHGLTRVVDEDGTETLLLVDCESAEVVRTDTAGKVIEKFSKPKSPGKYFPTWAAQGPDGRVWITDGYGSSLIHVWDGKKWGKHLTGEEGAGRFDVPHAIAFSPEGELWIANRNKKTVAVYDHEGNFLRSTKACHTPTSFAFHKGLVYVAELHTGIKIMKPDFTIVAEIGDNPGVTSLENWPQVQRNGGLTPGKFNSPHGIDVDAHGNIFVAEWIIGGRVTKLEKL